MTNIRWGIVGTGSIATAFAHSIKYSNNSSLEAVYGRNESKLKDFCNKFEVESINEPNNLFTADHIDAIYIATPHSTHYEYCLSAIRNKKHILCEKPLTVNHLESMVLLNLAKESNVFLMEAFMYRAHPQTANILDSLDVFQDSKEEIIIESSFGLHC
jgi:predicted dehydrogenase